MKQCFEDLHRAALQLRGGEEGFSLYYQGEVSTFCRLNNGKVRQLGDVVQHQVHLNLYLGKRKATKQFSLAEGSESELKLQLQPHWQQLRSVLEFIEEDPYLLRPAQVNSSEQVFIGDEQTPHDVVAQICAGANERKLDLVGIYSQGRIYRGFADDRGQFNWYARDDFNFDWSLYLEQDKAVKQSYAGDRWRSTEFNSLIETGAQQLRIMGRPQRQLRPGRYRTYLAPSAMEELLGILSWGSFSTRSFRTQQSPLGQLGEARRSLHPQVSLSEDCGGLQTPRFSAEGFIKPDCLSLIEAGALVGSLTSPRTAQEFGLAADNGANEGEYPESLALAAGDLPAAQVLAELGEGLYVNNLWYTNYSDRSACRITGMTRFAAFWVEGGEIVAPVNVMRFDDTIYRMLGEGLVAVTDEAAELKSSSTYERRSCLSMRSPGVILEDFNLTL